jgi:excinuclease ABC subunit A
VVASGTPEHVAAVAASHTGRYLKPILGKAAVSRGPAPARKPRRGSGTAMA